MTTSIALLFSTNLVTCLRPYFSRNGLGPALSSLFWPSRRFFFWSTDSGRYLERRRKREPAWVLSRVERNWFIDGGTFSLVRRTRLLRWSWIYSGQRTYLCWGLDIVDFYSTYTSRAWAANCLLLYNFFLFFQKAGFLMMWRPRASSSLVFLPFIILSLSE